MRTPTAAAPPTTPPGRIRQRAPMHTAARPLTPRARVQLRPINTALRPRMPKDLERRPPPMPTEAVRPTTLEKARPRRTATEAPPTTKKVPAPLPQRTPTAAAPLTIKASALSAQLHLARRLMPATITTVELTARPI